MLGYPLKDYGTDRCKTIFRCNMSNERIHICKAAHAAVARYNVFKGRTMMQPAGWLDSVAKWAMVHCVPLLGMMDPAHVVRFMILKGKHMLSPKWCDASGGNAVDWRPTKAYMCVHAHMPDVASSIATHPCQ